MNFRLTFLALILSILLSCNNEEVVTFESLKQKLTELKRLGTLEYDISKILIVDDEQWYTIGDRKALISLKANLIAGIDFEKIKIIDFKQNESIKLKLPEPEIILLNIPPDKIEYSVLKTSYMRSEFSNDELNKIQILGEEDINEKIKDLGVLIEAEKNAKIFLDNWLNLLGFKNIYYANEKYESEDQKNIKESKDTVSIDKDGKQLKETEDEKSYIDQAKELVDTIIN